MTISFQSGAAPADVYGHYARRAEAAARLLLARVGESRDRVTGSIAPES